MSASVPPLNYPPGLQVPGVYFPSGPLGQTPNISPTDLELYLRNYLNDYGQTPFQLNYMQQKDSFIANTGQAIFNLSQTPVTFSTVFVFVNGILQYSPDNYTFNGGIFTFNSPLSGGKVVAFFYLYA